MMFPETERFPVVSRDETLRVVTFATDVMRVVRFEIPETLREPTNSEAVFRTVIFARGVTSVVRFDVPETLREPTNSEAVFKSTTLARGVTRELRFARVRLDRDAWRLLTFSIPNTLRVWILARGLTSVVTFARVRLDRDAWRLLKIVGQDLVAE